MIQNQPHELTTRGKNELEKELKQLREVDRVENIKALQEARAQGDLSENADYDAARDQQGKINSRINEIEAILKNYVIIQKDKTGVISTGSTVEVRFKGEDDTEKYRIIGTLQTDPLSGKISNQSPLGKALIGKKVGQTCDFKSETGREFTVEIVEVK
jgi:transcription elongation factor GreA